MASGQPLIHLKNIIKHFGSVVALNGVSMDIYPGEVMGLLGDNGAGKSTLIKVLSGVHQPSSGTMMMHGAAVKFSTPRQAMDAGIATVHQDLGMIPLMSVSRNFFMGREPIKRFGPIKLFDHQYANQVTCAEMQRIGIDVRDPDQAVGTLSGGERQTVAIARAVHFGAKVLILDEPTSALGVAQTSMVLKYIDKVRKNGLAVILITHNVRHAYAVGDRFIVLNRGTTLETNTRDRISMEELQNLMAGGKELQDLNEQLQGTV